MKKFLQQFFLFGLPILVTGYVIDVFLSNTLKKSNSYTGEFPTWNAILDGKVNSNIVIYGSSRAWVHFNPQIIEKQLHQSTYNLGIDGHNFKMQYLRHKLLLKNNKKPKLILHSVDFRTLEERADLYNPDQILPYMLWNKDFFESTISYEGYNWFDYNIPLIRYFGKTKSLDQIIKSYRFPYQNPINRIKGYKGNDAVWNNDLKKAKLAIGRYNVKINKELRYNFERYIKECKIKNIKLILIYSPEYIDGQKFIINRNESIELFKSYANTYNILFIDYSKNSICFDKKYFYNASHLNKTGAELFTAKVVDTIQKLKILKE
jgi:hypothetical protein